MRRSLKSIVLLCFKIESGFVGLSADVTSDVMRALQRRPVQTTIILLSTTLACVGLAIRVGLRVALRQALQQSRRARLRGGFASGVAAGLAGSMWGATQCRRGYRIARILCLKVYFSVPLEVGAAVVAPRFEMLPHAAATCSEPVKARARRTHAVWSIEDPDPFEQALIGLLPDFTSHATLVG